MYHAIVRTVLKTGFRKMRETGSAAHVVAQFARDGVFELASESDLGGERRGRAAIAAWFDQVFRDFPDLRITPVDVVVSGMPWLTTVAARLRVEATMPDGSPYRNEGMQYLRLRFGRILEDRIYEDTGKLERALAVVRAARGASYET